MICSENILQMYTIDHHLMNFPISWWINIKLQSKAIIDSQ